MNRKRILSLFTMLAVLLVSVTASAATLNVNPDANALKSVVETGSNNFVSFIRSICGIVAVVFIVWGFLLRIGTSDPQKIAQSNQRFAWSIAAVVGIFVADKIVAFVLGIFGLGR